MYLIDLSVDVTTPINRMVEQSEWVKLFPGQVPRRVYYTFAKGKPVEITDDKIAKFLMEKYPTIRMTTMEIDKLIARVNGLDYNELKSYGLRYGWNLIDVSIKKEKLQRKIVQALRSYTLPMNAKEFDEFKKKRAEESKYRSERAQKRADTIKKNIAKEKKHDDKLKLAAEKEEKRLDAIRKAEVKRLKKISAKGLKKEQAERAKKRKADAEKEKEMRKTEEETHIADQEQAEKEDKKTKKQE